MIFESVRLSLVLSISRQAAATVVSRTAARARSAQGASQAEFLREGIFRCRAGVGGQGSRAAMESP